MTHTPLDGLPPFVELYSCKTLQSAPNEVGLYAWYGTPVISTKDYVADTSQGTDAGIERLRSVLLRHTSRFSPGRITFTGMGTFDTRYAGVIEDITADRLKLSLEKPGAPPSEENAKQYDARRSRAMSKTLDSPSSREALVRVLEKATPFFTAPIYVGVAKRLRERLLQHLEAMDKAEQALKIDPASRDTLLQAPDFGTRAIAASFSRDHLHVMTFDISGAADGLPAEQRRHIAQSAEWFLNRWHRPTLGRR